MTGKVLIADDDEGVLASNVRVYLVEDQALIRECLRTTLELEPHIKVVGEATEARRAIEEIEFLGIDVVLMDIGLPGMDGIQATRLLKEKYQDLAVVMLTSYQDEFVGDAIEAGAAGYLLKTCSSKQLIQAVQDACQGKAPLDPSLTTGLLDEVLQLRKAQRNSVLTSRQVEILKLVANGIDYREIGTRLSVGERTVNREMRNTFNRLGVNDATHAVSEAYKRYLI